MDSNTTTTTNIIRYTATAPDGTVAKRKSPRTYTHCVFGAYTTQDGSTAWTVKGWSSRLDLAQRVANQAVNGKYSRCTDAVIVEVEATTTKAAPIVTRTVVRPLDMYERRGTLSYMMNGTVREVQAWFMLSNDGRSVVARKVGGRNRWRICRTDEVLEFRVEVK